MFTVSPLPTRIDDALRLLRSRLEARFGARLVRLVLFGSQARGEAGPESDVDVLVLLEGLQPAERTAIYEIGADVWMDTGVPVAPLAMSPDQLAELRRRERLLALDIDRDGISV